jgi:hypothetical protein
MMPTDAERASEIVGIVRSPSKVLGEFMLTREGAEKCVAAALAAVRAESPSEIAHLRQRIAELERERDEAAHQRDYYKGRDEEGAVIQRELEARLDPDAPKGVVAILTGPDGYVWATVADFDQSAPGGCSLEEGQELRAGKMVAVKFLQEACARVVADAISDYQRDEIVRTLCNDKGFNLTVVPIGHGSQP